MGIIFSRFFMWLTASSSLLSFLAGVGLWFKDDTGAAMPINGLLAIIAWILGAALAIVAYFLYCGTR